MSNTDKMTGKGGVPIRQTGSDKSYFNLCENDRKHGAVCKHFYVN